MTAGRKVLVHVGAPKTGTSFVQDLLFRNRDVLAAQGILYPADRFDEHFLAALDLMELQWGGLERQAVGAWDRLAERVRAWEGTAIVSHEILATASRPQVRRALASLGDPDEIHIVLSARDLVRQIPAEWQENVKHRRIVSYADFLARITDPRRTGALATWFWGVQEVPDILERWGGTLAPERVHLVTVPKPSAPRDLLWRRFAAVLGLDPDLPDEAGRTNPSLGVPETALLRSVNKRVNDGVLGGDDYRQFVRELLAHQTLSARRDSARLGLPPDVRSWAVDLSRSWIGELGSKGYDVVGDLAELLPDEEAPAFTDPDRPDPAQVAEAATDAIVALLLESSRLQHVGNDLRGELEGVYAELERSRTLWFRTKRRLLRLADENRAAALALRVYRRVRGSSSRSA